MVAKRLPHLLWLLSATAAAAQPQQLENGPVAPGLPVTVQFQDATGRTTIGDIDDVMGTSVMLQALAEMEEARRRYGQKGDPAPVPQRPALGGHAAPNDAGVRSLTEGEPTTTWRRQTSSGWVAQLRYQSGYSLVVKVGDHIPDGYTIVSIDMDSVTVRRAGQAKRLLGGSEASPAWSTR